ncbi:type I restriction enzyme endonuclease domain-containing protein [Desulfoscipio gibsoniae]|uniref:type I restriction enzyme endonuclease domain-containing protein n=1 Tax=Desulfoscipio gibsoniae TaxID=102134 RepID=UPI000232B018
MLADAALREDFYQRLAEYAKTLGIALSTESFIMRIDEATLRRYKADLKRFQHLKAAVKLRYAEAVDYRDYEPKIKKLLDTHIQANEVIQLNKPVNIFDDQMFNQVKEEQGVYDWKTTAAKADTIAHATKRVITEKIAEDPAFYEKFSKLIQQAIEDFRAKRLSDLDYLNKVMEIRNKVTNRQHDDMPGKLSGNEDAIAYFGVIKPFFEQHHLDAAECEELSADTALAIQDILTRYWKVQFWDDEDAQKQVINEIDDYLFDEVKGNRGVEITLDQMDELIEKAMQVARYRSVRDER